MGIESQGVSDPNQFQPVIVRFVKDSYFVMEGKTDTDRFYIVQEGKVRISREADKNTSEKDSIAGPGDIVAAVSVMAGYSFIETAMAYTDVTLLAVERRQYSNLIRSNTPIALKIIQQFSQRLRTLNDMLSRLAMSAAAISDSSHLLQVANYYMGKQKLSQAYYAYSQYISHCPGGDKDKLEEAKQKMARINPLVKVLKPEYPQNKMERVYPAGCLLFAEGEPGNELFVIQEGSVKITKIVNNMEVMLALLQKGDILGEMALLEDKLRNATAEVNENCKVLAVNRANFEELIKTSPDLVARLTTLMAERIWMMYKQLANTMILNPLGRIYDVLLIQLVKARVPLDTNHPHQFNFGLKELAEMARVPPKDQDAVLKKIFLAKRISLVENKIYVSDPSEVLRQTEYNRRGRPAG